MAKTKFLFHGKCFLPVKDIGVKHRPSLALDDFPIAVKKSYKGYLIINNQSPLIELNCIAAGKILFSFL